MQFCLAACTDKGKTRAVNQDALLLQQAVCGRRRYVLAAVCDGLGGLEKGELASSEVLRSLADWFQSRFPEVLMAGFPERELLGDWKNLVHTENERLRTYGEKQGIVLGTTLTAALFTEENWYCVHVGDSRLYEIAADTARQLTRDHSLAAEAVERGFMTREEGERDRRRSVLTAASERARRRWRNTRGVRSGRTPCTFCARTVSWHGKAPDRSGSGFLSGASHRGKADAEGRKKGDGPEPETRGEG